MKARKLVALQKSQLALGPNYAQTPGFQYLLSPL
jgi:hypothetical protein